MHLHIPPAGGTMRSCPRPRGTSVSEDLDLQAQLLAVEGTFETLLTADYQKGRRQQVSGLYEKAKYAQWDAELDVDWSVGGQIDRACDPDNPLIILSSATQGVFGRLNANERATLAHAMTAWTVSQFLHLEQGALACAAKIVQAVPWLDAKFQAAMQVVDEARHTEVFARYLREKLEWEFPVNPHLHSFLDEIIREPRWDLTYLGMQIVTEGLALTTLGKWYRTTRDPLLKQITRYVLSDEARHVAFGLLSLREVYADLSAAEIRDRQEFCYEAALHTRDRLLAEDLWEALGLPVAECTEIVLRDPSQREYRRSLFANVVPNLKKLGLLDAGDGWLRTKFGELGVLEFEDWEDSSLQINHMDLHRAPWDVVQFQHYA
jgi:hypothetical protein